MFSVVMQFSCVSLRALDDFQAMMDRKNEELAQKKHTQLIFVEALAGRLYTGPMYEKYNGVLRFNTARGADGAVLLEYVSMEEVSFLQKKCGWLHLGEWVAVRAVAAHFARFGAASASAAHIRRARLALWQDGFTLGILVKRLARSASVGFGARIAFVAGRAVEVGTRV